MDSDAPIRDPVIEEIWAIRQKISAEHNHDTGALLRHYRELEKKYADRMLPRSRSFPRPE